MARHFSPFIRSISLASTVMAVLACGAGSSLGVVGGGGAAAIATATTAPTATATIAPTATPTPAHLLVTVHPVCNVGPSCTPYVCHNGTTCQEHGICTASAWPTFTLSDSGQVSLMWNGTINGNGAPTTGWTLAPTSGSLGGGASTTVTLNDNPTMIATTNPSVIFTGAAQVVTITMSCGIG